MLIKYGTLVNADGSFEADIRIEDGIITDISKNLLPELGEEVTDATDYIVVPGGIDAHTHFDMPCGAIHTSDDFYHGTMAAVAGGTTTIIDFSEPESATCLQNGLNRWHEKADGHSFCDYSFHMTLSRYDDLIEHEIVSMISQGITSFKAYTAYKDDIGVEDGDMYRLLALMKKHHTLLMIHCENGDILEQRRKDFGESAPEDIFSHPRSRPNAVEHDAVSRLIDMARILKAPVYIVHTSTHEALLEIKEARSEGVRVCCETCPQYLFLTEEKYLLPGFEGAKYVCSPPLRKEEDKEALWRGMRDGTVDTLSTDHCSFLFKGQKDLGRQDFRKIPSGLPGVENRMELLYSSLEKQGLTYCDAVRLTAENPARIFGLYPKKGVIAIGSDADIVLMAKEDPHIISAKSQYQHVDYNPYEGMVVSHKIRDVFLRGQRVVEDGHVISTIPLGQYLFRKNPEK